MGCDGQSVVFPGAIAAALMGRPIAAGGTCLLSMHIQIADNKRHVRKNEQIDALVSQTD
jgi:hypothetical protein